MVYHKPEEFLVILPIKDIVSAKLVCHHYGIVLADFLQYSKKLLTTKLLTFLVAVRYHSVYSASVSFLNTDDGYTTAINLNRCLS